MKTRLEFNALNKSSEEILQYVTSLVKQYCLESEWKQLEEVFVEFYTPYQIELRRHDIQECSYEFTLVVKLLNNIYVSSSMGGKKGIARTVACNVALRCGCYNHLTF